MNQSDLIAKSLKKLGDDTFTKTLPLPRIDSWPETVHLFDKEQVWALRAAIAAERPLLVRGEPGTGKSQLARAAAVQLGRAFMYSVIFSRSESRDLLFHFDEVTRLGEAQILSTQTCNVDVRQHLDPLKFISPGVLWWAFAHKNASEQYELYSAYSRKPYTPVGWQPTDGSVVLIDEIDKAEAELPNGLLETLGNGSFSIPHLKESIGLCDDCPPPLVIITTNEVRELPDAFERRCLVLHLSPPRKDDALRQWLIERGKIHFRNFRDNLAVLGKAADMLIEDRKKVLEEYRVGPGLAEYLDMLRAVARIPGDPEENLNAVGKFALQKKMSERDR